MKPRPNLGAIPLSFGLYRRLGRVTRINDLSVESRGPAVALGEICQLKTPTGRSIEAEVVGLEGESVILMPYGPSKGLVIGAEVQATDMQPSIPVGTGFLGRVIDAFGQPLEGGPIAATGRRPLHPEPLGPLARTRIEHQIVTGVRVIDSMLPLGRGQRLGIFAGSGVGKSSLLGMLATHLEADVIVMALIGERGREVGEFIDKRLRPASRGRAIVVVATADQPAVVRARAAYAATSIAEHFRDLGQHVVLLMDSVTRFAMARREIDLAAGQPPTARGYTPSVFSAIPALCERAGAVSESGSITALYTVLVEGDEMNEPVSDALRATLDGHVVLSRELASEGHFPAIDVLQSVSRLESDLLSAERLHDARQLRALIAAHRRQRDMVDMGLYRAGSNATLDQALLNWDRITGFLRQDVDQFCGVSETHTLLSECIGRTVSA